MNLFSKFFKVATIFYLFEKIIFKDLYLNLFSVLIQSIYLLSKDLESRTLFFKHLKFDFFEIQKKAKIYKHHRLFSFHLWLRIYHPHEQQSINQEN